jgi:hypothetical protein
MRHSDTHSITLYRPPAACRRSAASSFKSLSVRRRGTAELDGSDGRARARPFRGFVGSIGGFASGTSRALSRRVANFSAAAFAASAVTMPAVAPQRSMRAAPGRRRAR